MMTWNNHEIFLPFLDLIKKKKPELETACSRINKPAIPPRREKQRKQHCRIAMYSSLRFSVNKTTNHFPCFKNKLMYAIVIR